MSSHFNIYILLSVVLLLRVINAVSVDCPMVIQFAYNLGMQTTSPSIWSQLQSNCCYFVNGFNAVTCVSNRVTQIEWYNIGLNGSINGTAIPSSLTFLNLQKNSLVGSIPAMLPLGLTALYIDGNSLSGGLPTTLPQGLKTLYVFGNQLTGDLPMFPSTIQYLALGY